MCSVEVDYFNDLLKINIETIPSDRYKCIALLGDFNDRCQTWNDNHGKSELERQLVDLIYSSNFEQIISLPTTPRRNKEQIYTTFILPNLRRRNL